jgi:UTP--glucose-1-phosphate uridylyltransferase
MSPDTTAFDGIAALMRAEDLPDAAIAAFGRHHAQLAAGATGLIPESALEPVSGLPDADDLDERHAEIGRRHLHEAVVIKLNGGLGTSMGLSKAKSLLPVKQGQSFLQLIAHQARGAGCPLVLMNSFSTQDDSLALLDGLDPLPGDLPRDFLQHKVPKLDRQTLQPVAWPDERLRWCPPGHGDIYNALVTRGVLAELRAAGVRTAFVSNSDNLGATLDPRILGYFLDNGLPFLMEVADRTAADRKGGHLALQGEQLILRESAQCPPGDVEQFQDVTRHRYFNTNNLWIDLVALERLMAQHEGALALPLIRNAKTVDPRDTGSTPVYQLESAMGSAIALFEGAAALRVPRTRFSPVKTTADLLRVRSDATSLTDDGRVVPATGHTPLISLDAAFYKKVSDLEARFPGGAPSLVGCRSLTVEGDWTFGAGVVVRGDVSLQAETPQQVPDGTLLEG